MKSGQGVSEGLVVEERRFYEDERRGLNIRKIRRCVMKKIASMVIAALMFSASMAETWTDAETGITWDYRVSDDEVSVQRCSLETGDLVIPSVIDGKKVTSLDEFAFFGCSGLTSVVIPEGVTSIGDYAFNDCPGLKSVTIPSSVMNIRYSAFIGCGIRSFKIVDLAAWCRIAVENTFSLAQYDHKLYLNDVEVTDLVIPDGVTSIRVKAFCRCSDLTSVTIPSSVTNIGGYAFANCYDLSSIIFNGDAPEVVGDQVFEEAAVDAVIYVKKGTKGWTDKNGNLMKRWPRNTASGRPLAYIGESPHGGDSTGSVALTVTNVVVHYVLNSVKPDIAVPIGSDAGFVTVVTEVKSSGAVSVPSEWKDNYPLFVEKFGGDFAKALTMKSGKKDGAGNDMLVWQDYVAGTDPTRLDDRFTASITLVGGVPVISYTPELSEEQKALRVYKFYGKRQLQDAEWTDVTDLDGEGRKSFNFFKVTVEMK